MSRSWLPHRRSPVTPERRWVELLHEIVDIDSGPDDTPGLHRVLDRLGEEFDVLGFEAQRRSAAPGPDVLVATREGVSDPTRVLLLGHADTVFASGAAAERPFTICGDGRATGPGIADMKAGLVVMLAALAALPAQVLDRLHVTAMINGDEESGSAHSQPLIEQVVQDAQVALVFEPGRPPDRAVHARRGAQRYRLRVTGRAAHTGVNPQDGANVIVTLAHHVLALQRLDECMPRGTVTSAIIEGGTRPNIVPDAGLLHVDSRFDDAEIAGRIKETILGLGGAGPVDGTSTTVEVLDGRPAFAESPRGRELAALFVDVAADLGMELATESTGGSSDGNFAAARGVPTLDGLGAVGAGYHTTDEYIELSTIASRADLCAAALTRLALE